MKTTLPGQVRPRSRFPRAGRKSLKFLAAVLLQGALLACGPVEDSAGLEAESLQAQAGEVVAFNGLSLNGMSINGLSLNGLSLNGLSVNGLSTSAFAAWFSENPALSDEVMTYVVRCAVPRGERRDYTDPETGRGYTWWGGLGLAPDWSNGRPASLAEQQLVSACLAAHVNKYGKAVFVSVLGTDARGESIYSAWELEQFSEREACFFGNLFNGGGVYVGNDRGAAGQRESNARGCGLLSTGQPSDACAPLVHVMSCGSVCKLDPTKTYYTSCAYKGVTYVPLTTRLRSADVYRCGDGTCQFTESCGNGSQYYNCRSDCGRCR